MSGDGGGGERHVGPPRTLEVQKFAAARSAEVQALYNAVKDQVEASGGDPSSLTIARHLRRRTTSHNRRVPYWILNERRKNSDGHISQKRKKAKKNEEIPSAVCEKRKSERPPLSRRVRRRIEFQGVRRGENIVQRDGTRRLATHVWHAKRFPMTKCWGYSLPEGLAGRGRGSRAVLKWVKDAAVLHDASYYGLIELQGTSEAIARILKQTVEPAIWSPSSESPLKKAEAHGLLSGNAVLYQVGKAPYDAIAPITFIWRPPASDWKLRATGPEQVQSNVTPEERQLWIWVHPGAYEPALECLLLACEGQGKDDPVKCRSRRSEFSRLEILGSKATEVIRKVIHPTSRKFENPLSKTSGQPAVRDGDASNSGYPIDGDSGQPKNLAFFSKVEFLPSSAVLALNVLDPRCRAVYNPSVPRAERDVGNGGTEKERHEDIQSATHRMDQDPSLRNALDGPIDRAECPLSDEDGLNLSASWLDVAEEGLSREVADSEFLWNPQSGTNLTRLAPMSEKTLCRKRHEERKKFLLNVDPEITTKGPESHAKDQMNISSFCPVLLLRSSKSVSPACGWTVILPIKWVNAFWIRFVFAGGRVIGLRERHWLATNAGVPHFPHDFPDCATYAQLLTTNLAASDEVNRKRPPAKRCPRFVISPLQITILKVFENKNGSSGHMEGEEDVKSGLEAKSVLTRGSYSQSPERISCIKGAEVSMRNLEEPRHTSFEVTEAERQEKGSFPEERQHDVKVVHSASDYVPMVVERSSGSVISQSCDDREDRGTSVSGRGTDQTLLTQSSSEVYQVACTTGVAKINSGNPVIPNVFGTDKEREVKETSVLKESQDLANLHRQSTDPGDAVDRFSSGGAADLVEGFEAGSLLLDPAARSVDVVAVRDSDLTLTTVLQSSVDRFDQDHNSAVKPRGAVSSEAESSEVVMRMCTHEDGGLLNQSVPSDQTMTESATSRSILSAEEAKMQLSGGLASSLALETGQLDAAGTCVITSASITPFSEGRAVSNQAVDSATKVEVPLLRTKATGLTLKSDDIVHASRVCEEETARLEPFNSEEIMEWAGDDKDRRGNCDVEDPRTKSLPFFVARTQSLLLETLNQSGFQQALFLHQGVTSKGTIKDAVQQKTLRWSAVSEAVSSPLKSASACAVVNGQEKVCYTRVLVNVPRRGVMEEGAVIFSPNEEDRDMFFRSKDWQGPSVIQPKNVKWKRKDMESVDGSTSHGKAQGSKGRHENADARCEAWSSNRKSIGLITSSVPRGSTGPCIGVCDIGALMKLRGGQSADRRWWDRRDIFVLAGNKYSSKLRPALISLPLERAEDDVEWL